MALRNCNNQVKGICSVIATIFINLITGSIFTFPNIISYYQVYSEHKFTKNKLYFVAPTGIFTFSVLGSVTGILDDKFGTRILNIAASILLLGSHLLIYFFKIYAVLIIAYILFGIGDSLTYFQSLKNCWKYFPEQKGLISGIVLSCFGLGAFIFTSIADGVIKSNEGSKDEDIIKGFKKYLIIVLVCIGVAGTLSSILCFPYKKIDQYIAGLKLLPDDNSENPNPKEEENNIEEEKKDGKKDEKTLKETILSKDFALCLIMSVCTSIFGFLLTNTYRSFGETSFINNKSSGDENEKMKKNLKALSKVFTLLNTFSRILWGFIADRVRFKILYPIVCIVQIICGATIYFSAGNIVAYFIVTNLAVLSFAGHVILFPNLIHTKFGVDKSVYLLGICGIFTGIAALIGPILSIFVLKEKKDYLILYLVGAAPTIGSLIISLILKVEIKPKEEPKNNIIDDHYYDDIEEPENEEENTKGIEIK